MAPPSLQEAIDQAGSPVKLLWKPGTPAWVPPVLPPEYVGWRTEQQASSQTVALSDLSHHMGDLFIDGPDAMRLLMDYSANKFANFEIGQAKQFVPVNRHGQIITDGILMRTGPEAFVLSGVPSSQNWIRYHGEQGGYKVDFRVDLDSAFRAGGGDPVLFRYQIQGPAALELTARVFGGPLPQTKFFHSTPVELEGRRFRAFRHGMTGQPGFEFIGDYADHEPVLEALLSAGESLGLVRVGALAYSNNGVQSGWIPTPTPAIYSDPELQAYREWLSVFTFEGQTALLGSYFSEDIEDYYVSPWELGYGRSISLEHDFLGRDALMAARETVTRTKVTVVLDPEDVAATFGADLPFMMSHGRFRIESGSELVGMTFYTGMFAAAGTILALSLVETGHADPGTPVELVWGEHPGPGTPPDADLGFTRLRGTVQPAPYDEFARTQYRADAPARA
jgi:vanillate/3-O-methylgallate O-demethylase